MNKMSIYESRKVSTTTILLLHFFFGWSYGSLDKMGLQFLFWFTGGGFFIWYFVRFFTISGAVKAHNRTIGYQIGLDDEEMSMLGLLY